MAFDEDRQINVEQLLILDTYSSIDYTQINPRWMAKDERGQWIVNRSSCQVKRVETVADKIGCHTRRKIANIVAT
jgi:hypothetical protein